jgi:hypothetical protein
MLRETIFFANSVSLQQAQHFRSSNTYSDIGLPDTSPDDFLKKRILGDSVRNAYDA